MEIIKLSSLTLHDIIVYSAEIYELLNKLEKQYPYFKSWFINKQIVDLLEGKREIIFAYQNGEIIGVSCLKKEENKICTLFVKEEHRRQKIGTKLLEESMKYLNTTKPFITMSKQQVINFKSFIIKYDWNINEINNIYNHIEYCFNGNLKKSYTK